MDNAPASLPTPLVSASLAWQIALKLFDVINFYRLNKNNQHNEEVKWAKLTAITLLHQCGLSEEDGLGLQLMEEGPLIHNTSVLEDNMYGLVHAINSYKEQGLNRLATLCFPFMMNDKNFYFMSALLYVLNQYHFKDELYSEFDSNMSPSGWIDYKFPDERNENQSQQSQRLSKLELQLNTLKDYFLIHTMNLIPITCKNLLQAISSLNVNNAEYTAGSLVLPSEFITSIIYPSNKDKIDSKSRKMLVKFVQLLESSNDTKVTPEESNLDAIITDFKGVVKLFEEKASNSTWLITKALSVLYNSPLKQLMNIKTQLEVHQDIHTRVDIVFSALNSLEISFTDCTEAINYALQNKYERKNKVHPFITQDTWQIPFWTSISQPYINLIQAQFNDKTKNANAVRFKIIDNSIPDELLIEYNLVMKNMFTNYSDTLIMVVKNMNQLSITKPDKNKNIIILIKALESPSDLAILIKQKQNLTADLVFIKGIPIPKKENLGQQILNTLLPILYDDYSNASINFRNFYEMFHESGQSNTGGVNIDTYALYCSLWITDFTISGFSMEQISAFTYLLDQVKLCNYIRSVYNDDFIKKYQKQK